MKYQFSKMVVLLLLAMQIACNEAEPTPQVDAHIAPVEQNGNVANKVPNNSIAEANNGAEQQPTVVNKNNIEDFVPEGYVLHKKFEGMLNEDDKKDAILVVTQKEMDNSADRPIILLISNETGNYEQVARNDKAVLCAGCGGMLGDPFQQVVIKDGYFTIEHFGGSADRWARYSTFKYDTAKKDWLWHKDATELTSAHDLKYEKMVKIETDNRSFSAFVADETE